MARELRLPRGRWPCRRMAATRCVVDGDAPDSRLAIAGRASARIEDARVALDGRVEIRLVA